MVLSIEFVSPVGVRGSTVKEVGVSRSVERVSIVDRASEGPAKPERLLSSRRRGAEAAKK